MARSLEVRQRAGLQALKNLSTRAVGACQQCHRQLLCGIVRNRLNEQRRHCESTICRFCHTLRSAVSLCVRTPIKKEAPARLCHGPWRLRFSCWLRAASRAWSPALLHERVRDLFQASGRGDQHDGRPSTHLRRPSRPRHLPHHTRRHAFPVHDELVPDPGIPQPQHHAASLCM